MSEATVGAPSMTGGRSKLQRKFVTPEGVDLRLQLADASERAGAFCLDVFFIFLALFGVSLVYALIAGASAEGEEALILWMISSFLIRAFYFTFFEIGPRAATPGKRLLGIRVAPRKGGRLTAEAIFARNAMRELEVFVPITFIFAGAGDSVDGWIILAGFVWGGIFAFFPLFNRDRLRPGDIIAGTWVVKAPKQSLQADIARAGEQELSAFVFSKSELNAYGIHELHLLEDILRIRDADVMALVAERIRNKIKRPAFAGDEDDKFLDAYYTALRQRLETRLLYGVRRRDKTDLR